MHQHHGCGYSISPLSFLKVEETHCMHRAYSRASKGRGPCSCIAHISLSLKSQAGAGSHSLTQEMVVSHWQVLWHDACSGSLGADIMWIHWHGSNMHSQHCTVNSGCFRPLYSGPPGIASRAPANTWTISKLVIPFHGMQLVNSRL